MTFIDYDIYKVKKMETKALFLINKNNLHLQTYIHSHNSPQDKIITKL